MANSDLIRFIRDKLGHGLSADEIGRQLVQAGWKKADIDAAFLEAGAGKSVAGQGGGLSGELAEIRRALDNLNRRILKLEGEISPEAEPLFPLRREAPVYEVPAETAGGERTAGKAESVESKVTGKWFAIVGVLALVFGVGFFLKYAFENNLIGVTGRVIMGILGGLALLALGSVLQKKEKYRTYSFFISGGGLALLYLSIYGAFNFYHLISQTTAFLFMILITAGGAALSVVSAGKPLAALALLGGFLTPFLVSTGTDNQIALFGYILILNLGFLGISNFKKWLELYYLNFAGTYAVFYAWFLEFYEPEKLSPTLIFLTLFFAVFLTAPFLLNILKSRKSDAKDTIASTLNTAVYFATSYGILKPDYESALGFFFVLGAVAYLALAYLLSARSREDRYGIFTLAGIGLTLLTLAVPIQLDRNWITIAWAVEGLMLTWIGFSLRNYYLRLAGDAVFIITAFRLLFFDISLHKPIGDFVVFWNDRFLTYLIASAALFAAAYFYQIYHDRVDEQERRIPSVLGAAANVFLVMILSLEATAFFDKKIHLIRAAESSPTVFNRSVPSELPDVRGELSDVRGLKNMQNLSLSVIWALYSAGLMLIGILRRVRYTRLLSILLFGIVIFKVFLFDIAQLKDIYRILSFITLGVILLVVSFLFYRYKDKIKKFLMEE